MGSPLPHGGATQWDDHPDTAIYGVERRKPQQDDVPDELIIQPPRRDSPHPLLQSDLTHGSGGGRSAVPVAA